MPVATTFPFAIEDDSFAYKTADNYNFKVSSSSYEVPLSNKVGIGVDSLNNYLTNNKGKELNIIGYYTANENNETAYPNLGIARANSVKNHFVSKGIPSSIINISGELKEELISKDKVYLGPLSFALNTDTEDHKAELEALYNKIKENPLVLHFKTGEAAISLTPEQRQKIANISMYLDKVDEAKAKIIGHTDNTGGAEINLGLGKNRADYAKTYFTQNGIPAEKLETSSKGQTEPIADNNTAEGRSQNRRTVVTLN